MENHGIDLRYQELIQDLLTIPPIVTRNHAVRSLVVCDPFRIIGTPLVTLRKTAKEKALEEFEWFCSGHSQCPEKLRDWWDGQLSPEGNYIGGYAEQFRLNGIHNFDQLAELLTGLREHPHSRRHILTAWEPWTMSRITMLNRNPQTPTTCHTSFNQYFVRNGFLHGLTVQRSADVLLGLPHNFVQQWALLLYLAHHAGLYPGVLRYVLGDVHLYDEPSHIECAQAIAAAGIVNSDDVTLHYQPAPFDDYGCPPFLASDFVWTGEVPAPATTLRPKLL